MEYIIVNTSYYLWTVILAMGAVVVLVLITMFFTTLLTKNMKESRVTEERLRVIIDNMPLVSNFRDKDFNILECNAEAVKLFSLSSKEEYLERFFDLSPEYQPDGRLSLEKSEELILEAFEHGSSSFEWMHQKLDGTPIPCEVTLSKVQWCGEENLIAFVRDLREINKAVAMVQQLEKAAFTDPLTGAFNRRYLIEESEKQIKLCGDAGLNYSLIMLDVDHFKQINDTYGHHVGDEVLKILVRRMRHSLKKDTLIARYGGEEFVITLPGASLDNALSTAERMRNTVRASNFAISGIELPITISLGVASISHCGIDLQELLNNADKAMYKAKNSGRNISVKYDASEELRSGYVRTDRLANTK